MQWPRARRVAGDSARSQSSCTACIVRAISGTATQRASQVARHDDEPAVTGAIFEGREFHGCRPGREGLSSLPLERVAARADLPSSQPAACSNSPRRRSASAQFFAWRAASRPGLPPAPWMALRKRPRLLGLPRGKPQPKYAIEGKQCRTPGTAGGQVPAQNVPGNARVRVAR